MAAKEDRVKKTETTTETTTKKAPALAAQFRQARTVSVPLVGISTADQTATIQLLAADWPQHPLVQWDAAQGITGVNQPGKEALITANITGPDTINFPEAMVAAQALPQKAVLFVHNAQRQLASQEPSAIATAVQAVANLRDRFKQNYRCLVLLAPSFVAPSELAHDIITYVDPLPARESLKQVVEEIHVSAKQPVPKGETLDRAMDAATGLPLFEAEQIVSLSLTEKGLDLDQLWERKRLAIEATPGLSVWRGAEKFTDLVGLDAVKRKLSNVIKGRQPVGCFVFVDEIDKVLANVEQDTTGTRMYQLRSLLTKMEDNNWNGIVCVGVPGAGKSALAKAAGNEAGVVTIALDLGETESKFVGESEENVRHAIRVIESVGGGRAFFIATSNAATVMRPELQRRFHAGMFFFDVMTAEQRAAAWVLYMRKFGLPAQPVPADDGWTGAEIRNCCYSAWNESITLVEAARFIVPMARSRADDIENLRRYAHGRFLDATKDGAYVYDQKPMAAQVRAISVGNASIN